MRINYFWELSLFQRTERQKRFLISHNRFIYIRKSEWFLISQNQFLFIQNFLIAHTRFCDIKKSQWFCDIIKSNMWYHKIDFVDVTKSLWYQQLEVVISYNRGLIFIAKRHRIIFRCISTDVIVCSNFYRTSATSIASVSTVWRPLMVLMPSSGIVSRFILTNMLLCCGHCWMPMGNLLSTNQDYLISKDAR